MEELATIMGNVARLLAIVGGGLSAVAVCYAGIMWMTASGDPNKMGQARMALMGAVGGLVIVGIAFIVPRIISQAVIEPVGGVSLQSDVGLDCDRVLRNQLIFQRGASTAAKMNVVIRQIQAQRDECSSETWNPKVDDATSFGVVAKAATATDPAVEAAQGCFTNPEGSKTEQIGDTEIPRSLRDANAADGQVRTGSGRDSSNNMIIYWSGSSAKRPSDGAICWLYVSRLRVWDENY